MVFDSKQNLVIGANNGQNILVYAPPYTGNPNQSTFRTGCNAIGIALNAYDSSLWYDCSDRVFQLTYPIFRRVKSSNVLTRFGLTGLAVSPASPL
jgi:hypothetical protein